MHRAIAFAAFLFAAGLSPAKGQDSTTVELSSGTIAKAWKVDTGWIEGQIARVFPDGGGECFVFFSDTLSGVVGFGRLDSLMVLVLPDPKAPDDGRARLWQVLSPRVLWQQQLTRLPACAEL